MFPPRRRCRQPRRLTVIQPDAKAVDFGSLAADYGAAVDMGELQDLADSLGLTVEAIVRLRIGWAADHRAWAFPMHGSDGRVRGIRLRTRSGKKFSVIGGREGLFMPVGTDFAGTLLLPEGPTTTAAVMDFGFQATGRPNCSGGVKLLSRLLRDHRTPEAVVVGDNDDHGAGQRGAEALASALALYVPRVRVIYPPKGCKDFRDYKKAGATHSDVRRIIDTAPVKSIKIRTRSK